MKKQLKNLSYLMILFTFLTSTIYAANFTWYNSSIEEQTDNVEATFTVTPSAQNINSVIGFSGAEANAYSDLGIIVRFNPKGKIDARNGSIYGHAAAGIAYQANTEYSFRLEIDFNTKTYSIYVTPKGGTEVK